MIHRKSDVMHEEVILRQKCFTSAESKYFLRYAHRHHTDKL